MTATTDPTTYTDEEQLRRTDLALKLVEEAQQLMLDACQQICPVNGGVREWTKLAMLYDRIHAAWYDVERVRGRVASRIKRARSLPAKG